MDFMIGWFPTIKLLVMIVFIGAIVLLVKGKNYKLAIVIFVFGFSMYSLAPLKYDGTNTKRYHRDSENRRTVEYKYVSKEADVVDTKKKSFAEIMEEEDRRSEKANKELMDEF